MPGIDGIEVHCRPREIGPNLAVIIVTGYPSAETAAQAGQLGAYAYVTKPVDPDELSHPIADALEQRCGGGLTAAF